MLYIFHSDLTLTPQVEAPSWMCASEWQAAQWERTGTDGILLQKKEQLGQLWGLNARKQTNNKKTTHDMEEKSIFS